MNKNTFILKGNILYSKTKTELSVTEQGFLICFEGISQGVYPQMLSKTFPLSTAGTA